MTDTPAGGAGEPTEPTRPDQLEPPAPAATPTVETPTTAARTAETPTTAPPTLETPTTAAPTVETPPVTAPTAQVPVAPAVAAPVATDDAPRRRGVFVPWWALAVVAALVVFGGGYLIGHAVGDDGNDVSGVRVANPSDPFGGNTNPFGGNGNRIPDPSVGNGNGSNEGGNRGGNNGGGNSNGNGGGATSASPAFLGVGVTTSTNPAGVRVTTVVASGPASDAGLQRGDVITAVDGKSVRTMEALRAAIAAHKPGDDVKVTYTRDGTEKTLTVSLGDRTSLSQ